MFSILMLVKNVQNVAHGNFFFVISCRLLQVSRPVTLVEFFFFEKQKHCHVAEPLEFTARL